MIEPYLRQVTCQQLFLAYLQRPKNGGQPVGKAGRRGISRELGEVRGWRRWIASDVDRALVIVLSGYCEGELIRYSELFPALRVRGLPVVRTAEVLDRLGLFSDDRAPAVDRPQPHDPDPCPRQAGGVIQSLDQADIDTTIDTATTPDLRLIIALASVHAARPKTIRTMQLEDADLGNRRITVGGHVRPLYDLTRRAVLDWLDCRRNRWPNTANPHLLITQKTAVELGPAGKLWSTRATRNLTATLERLRVDRQLEEALTHGADPLHLALVFGIDEKTAIRYADSARKLLQSEPETGPAWPHGSSRRKPNPPSRFTLKGSGHRSRCPGRRQPPMRPRTPPALRPGPSR
ncbi:hypothetical protein [Streptomyces sp. NPDC051219]|uniref:hypothetical protein n=1 Tax=Streptomyces sp. NPDC051219 TaxID=3155283 RepID=UPI00344039B2